MIEKELFNEKYIELFSPWDGVEFIYSILQNIGYNDFKSDEAREEGLKVIQKLFELELIEVFHWGNEHDSKKENAHTIDETMEYIKSVWFIGADFPDFHAMPMFKYKDWYIKNLETMGYIQSTNWSSFVNEKIINLEEWVEEKRPN